MLKKITLFFLFLLLSFPIYSQSVNANKDLHKWFDASIGQENTGLLDGFEVKDLYKSKNGDHKFYKSSLFQLGNITYKGQQYFDVEMKYDINEDELIVRIPTQTLMQTIQLIKEKVEIFSMNESKFIALKNVSNYDYGFYQVLYDGEKMSLYKKNMKTSNKYYSGRAIFYNFSGKEEYFLYFKGEYHKISKSKKSIKKLLPEYNKEIDLFYKSQNQLLRRNYDLFVQKLVSTLNSTNK